MLCLSTGVKTSTTSSNAEWLLAQELRNPAATSASGVERNDQQASRVQPATLSQVARSDTQTPASRSAGGM